MPVLTSKTQGPILELYRVGDFTFTPFAYNADPAWHAAVHNPKIQDLPTTPPAKDCNYYQVDTSSTEVAYLTVPFGYEVDYNPFDVLTPEERVVFLATTPSIENQVPLVVENRAFFPVIVDDILQAYQPLGKQAGQNCITKNTESLVDVLARVSKLNKKLYILEITTCATVDEFI